MHLRYTKNVLPQADLNQKVTALAWAPNGKKLAVAKKNRVVYLFDDRGDRQDQFPTKAADKNKVPDYIVWDLSWSADSSKLAVAQSDGVVFVYKLGVGWKEKKSICNKFLVQVAGVSVNCVVWPPFRNDIFYGLSDGKVAVGQLRKNTSAILYDTGQGVTALCCNLNGTAIISAHVDGSLYKLQFEGQEGRGPSKSKIAIHSCTPVAISWGYSVCVAGDDRCVTFYDANGGNQVGFFDYRGDQMEQSLAVVSQPLSGQAMSGFTVAVCNPTGTAVVLGNYESFFTFTYNSKSDEWLDNGKIEVPQLCAVSALAWKPDGAQLVVGGSAGVVDMYDVSLRRYRMRDTTLDTGWEVTVVASNVAIVKSLASTQDTADGVVSFEIRTRGEELSRLTLYNGSFAVGQTENSLVLVDLERKLISEVPWTSHADISEAKFVFDNTAIAMVHYAGEIMLVKYSQNEYVGAVRTEYFSPHLVSIGGLRDNSNMGEGQHDFDWKGAKIAYLQDAYTLAVMDLETKYASCVRTVENRVDFLELNCTCTLLLFRDVARRLFIMSCETSECKILLQHCSYVQWVPESPDVIVAQSSGSLCVWYSATSFFLSSITERTSRTTSGAPQNDGSSMAVSGDGCEMMVYPVRGEVVDIEKVGGVTQVVVEEEAIGNVENSAVRVVTYELDECLIQFGEAVSSGDLFAAMEALKKAQGSDEGSVGFSSRSLWMRLCREALQENELEVAEQSAAALNAVALVRWLSKTKKLALKNGAWIVHARLNMLNKNIEGASEIFINSGRARMAVNMYSSLHKHEEAILVAESHRFPEVADMKRDYFEHLLQTRQEDKAAVIREREGDIEGAVRLLLKASMNIKAADILLHSHSLRRNVNSTLVSELVGALCESAVFGKAGEVCDRLLHDYQKALDLYVRGFDFKPAIKLARSHFPSKVVELEKKWAEYLVEKGNLELAVNHFVEAGEQMQALETAVDGKLWTKVGQLLDIVESVVSARILAPYHVMYAKQLQMVGTAKNLSKAEWHFAQGGSQKSAVEMYLSHGKWDEARRLAATCLEGNQLAEIHMAHAQNLQQFKRYEEAEKSYIEVDEVDSAINMYKQARRFDDMIRLVKKYRKEYLNETHIHLGKQFAQEGNFSEAEKHFVQARPTTANPGWESAVDMYRKGNRWEDALRVAKVYGGKEASNRVAYMWAQSVGGESGRNLLKKLGLAKGAVDYAIQAGEYESAIQIAEHSAPEKRGDVLCACALAKVREGDFQGAEKLFVDAGRPEEGVRMYTNVRDWSAALKMAENFCPVVISEVYVAQGKHEFEKVHTKGYCSSDEQQSQFTKAEQLFILGNSPEEALSMYISEHLWQDARRICKRHCPHKLDMVTDAYQKFLVSGKRKKKAALASAQEGKTSYNDGSGDSNRKGSNGRVSIASTHNVDQQQDGAEGDIEDTISAAKMWEESGQWSNAIDAYVSVPPSRVQSSKYDVSRVWKRAVEISAQHLPQRYRQVATKVAVNLRDFEEKYMDAAKLFLEVEQPHEALVCLMKGSFWEEARRLSRQRLPDDVDRVEAAYHQYLIDEGDASSLLRSNNVDAKVSGLDILAAKKQWEQLLPVAKEEGAAVAGKYAAMCAKDKFEAGDFDAAAKVLAEWGAPPLPSNFQLYKDVSWGILGRTLEDEIKVGAARHASSAKAVKKYMYTVVKRLRTSQQQSVPEEDVQEMETLLMAAHYYSLSAAIITGEDLTEATTRQFQTPVSPNHKAAKNSSSSAYRNGHGSADSDDPLMDLAVKMSISQLRYVRVGGRCKGGVPADKAFFQAGILCKRQNKLRSAFVYLNRYLDIADAIDDGDKSAIDHADFKHTDIPGPEDMALPTIHYLSETLRDEVRDWVLAVSMDQKVIESLPTEKCENCNGQLAEGCLSCPSCHSSKEACIVTGFPVPPYDTIERSGCKACRKDWNTYIAANKLCPWSGKPEKIA